MSEAISASKYVYSFEEGRADMKDLLGGKGANLAEMTRLGLPVPPGFTITTDACTEYLQRSKLPAEIRGEIAEHLRGLEGEREQEFGGQQDPLLISVRSGARISMPGMMDTVLNLGLNDETVAGLAEATGDNRFALDCYRRLIQMFGNVVQGIPTNSFERILQASKDEANVQHDTELTAAELRGVVSRYKERYRQHTGEDFPQDPERQLLTAVEAVFASWDNERAQVYRRVHDIPHDLGTAVNVQAMVFGNRGDRCGTGVVFSRNPSTGDRELYGEYLVNAQGEDVVAGIRTPKPVSQLQQDMPEAYSQLKKAARKLEAHYRDMQDIEFTVESGQLFLLQTRTGKRNPGAAIRIAHDMVIEGLIDPEEALLRVDPEDIALLLHPKIDPDNKMEPIARGLPASPGAASGTVVFDADEAEQRGEDGESVVLVRPETTPDDVNGIVQARGVLTSRGGMTCHAAIVARGMGKPCVVGCDELNIDIGKGVVYTSAGTFRKGDLITIDGATGKVFAQEAPLIEPTPSSEFSTFLSWADEMREIEVRANADTPEDAQTAREFGGQGIGLCRTEHMFMHPDRLQLMQQMIMAESTDERRRALQKIEPMQQEDFAALFRIMDGLPVTIRLLDPPLHEFLPEVSQLQRDVENMRSNGASQEEIKEKQRMLRRAEALQESNPMLGQRGCRLGLLYPEIYQMQTRAIIQAAADAASEGVDVHPEIMIPLISDARECEKLYELVADTADLVLDGTSTDVDYFIGTMVEVPRACLKADEVAQYAEFFSFGTNDLTQTTYGFSRDDAEAKFFHYYLAEGILDENPFVVLDRGGVGSLIEMGIKLGRSVRPNLEVGICGEHGGDPLSIEFCAEVGMDYVSCSPYRVPVARLAAAQAQLDCSAVD